MLHFYHPDGSFVRIFPAGDPLGRAALPNAASAVKAVLFEPLHLASDGAGKPHWTIDESFRNEAFRVDDDGVCLPKSALDGYGSRARRRDPLADLQEVVQLRARTFIPLVSEARGSSR